MVMVPGELPYNGKENIQQVKDDHNHAFRTSDGFPAERENIGNDTDYHKDCHIINGGGIDGNRMNRSGYSQDKEQIENTGADDIADGKPRFPFSGGNNGSHQFRQRGADGDNRQSDEGFRHSHGSCDFLCAVNDNLSTCNNQNEAGEDEKKTFPNR